MNCPTCARALEVKCPCGRPECALATPVPFCPDCEAALLAKWEKAHGVAVCREHVKRELGIE